MQKHKYICFIMAIFLMFSNIGLAINIHYCKDVIAEISYQFGTDVKIENIQKNNKKECCGKEISDDEVCCKDEVVKQSVDNKQLSVKSFQLQLDAPILVEIYQLQIPEVFELEIPKNTFVQFYCESNAPPLYKLYRKLVFYA